MDEKRRIELYEELTKHSPNCITSLAVPLIAYAIVEHSPDPATIIVNYVRVGQALSQCVAELTKLKEKQIELDAARQVKELFEKLEIKI